MAICVSCSSRFAAMLLKYMAMDKPNPNKSHFNKLCPLMQLTKQQTKTKEREMKHTEEHYKSKFFKQKNIRV